MDPEVLTKNQFQIYRPEIERTLEKYQPEVREILANGGNLFQVIQMEIKGDTIYLKIKPIFKSEILLKKDQILLKIQESLGPRSPKQIR